MNNNSDECEELYATASMIEALDNPTNDEILDAALTFYDSAQCFDKKGDRKRAATAFTLSGEFYLSIEEHNKAAECYGKAILRNLMINDLESAKVILDKGVSYGDVFDTFNFRMARDSFNRQQEEMKEDDITELEDRESLFDSDSLDYDLELPDDGIDTSFNLSLEEIDLTENNSMMNIGEDIGFDKKIFISSYKGFNLSEKELSKDSKYSENIAFNLLKNTRQTLDKKIISSGVGKAKSGFIKDLDSGSKLVRMDIANKNGTQKQKNQEEILGQKLDSLNLDAAKIDSQDKLSSIKGNLIDEAFTLESEFLSISEITADDDDIEDIEIHDAIPFAWQIKDIDAGGFELLSQDVDQETGSLIFTWKRNKLERGETAQIKYILQRRLQRSVVMISNKRIYVLNSFHSLTDENDYSTLTIDFENPYNEVINHLLIEDIIPEELKVLTSTSSIKNRNLQVYSTKEGLVYRWIITDLKPKEKLQIEYKLKEKPFTRWFERVFDINGIEALKVEKIAEPLIERINNEYIIFYELTPDKTAFQDSFTMMDEIPRDAELISSYPTWLRPTVEENEFHQKYLSWSNIKLEGKTRRFCVRLKINDNYNPQEPFINFSSLKPDLKTVTQKDDRAEGVIDLRRRMGLALVNKQE